MACCHLEQLCRENVLSMTKRWHALTYILSEYQGHSVYRPISQIVSKVSLSTGYRILRLFEEAHILIRHAFGNGRFWYENASRGHHRHLINTHTG